MNQQLRATIGAMCFLVSGFVCQCQLVDSIAPGVLENNYPKAIHQYEKPKPFAFITNLPKDVWEAAKSPFEKNGWKGFLAVAASSAILIHFDQPLLDATGKGCKKIHLQPETNYKTLITIRTGKEDIKIFKMPKNLNSAFYTLGEGWIGVAIGGGFWVQGKLSNNYRSLQTSSDLMEGFLSTAVLTELIKHTTGRQSPFVRTEPGGKWTPFPSLSEFQRNSPNYDAFPSGHLATMMTTVTILADNYPENKWIKPIGYTLMGLTSLAMMNTQVHWAGDYPLALAIGYINGKIITRRHKGPHRKNSIL
jgi:PAP2 superfamily